MPRMRSLPGAACDGHSPSPAPEHVTIPTDQRNAPQPDAETERRPAPPKRHQDQDRSHENPCQQPQSAERHSGRCRLRHAPRLRPHHIRNLGFFGEDHHRDPDRRKCPKVGAANTSISLKTYSELSHDYEQTRTSHPCRRIQTITLLACFF